jgi:mono/diheme cytochrome c family protein
MYRLRSLLIPALISVVVFLASSSLASKVEANGRPGPTSGAPTSQPRPSGLRYESLALLPAVENAGQTDNPLPAGKGRDLALKYCVTCHAASVWAVQHHSQDQWNTVIDDMVSKGLDASDGDLATISAYLAANFGPVKKDSPAAPSVPPSTDTSPPPSSRR